MKTLILLLVLVSGCSNVWVRRGTLIAGNAAVACDLSQTLWMNHGNRWDRGYQEANPILGHSPSEETIYAANLGTIAVNTALYFILPEKWGTYVNAGVFGVEAANVTTQPLGSALRYGCRGRN